MSVQPEPPGGVIHDIGYRPYSGRLLGDGAVARSLFLTGLRNCYGLGRSGRSKVLPAILAVLMLVPAVILIAIQVLSGPDETVMPASRYPIVLQAVISVFVAAQAPTLFSRDLRFRTITLYLARPLLRRTYVLVRLASLVAAVFLLIAVPVLVLYAGGLMADLPFRAHTRDGALGLLTAALLALMLGVFAGLVSAVTTRRGLAVAAVISVLLVGYTLVSAVKGIASENDGGALGEWSGVLSPFTLVDGVMTWAFDTDPNMLLPPDGTAVGLGQLLVYAALTLGAVGLLLLRYRKVAAA